MITISDILGTVNTGRDWEIINPVDQTHIDIANSIGPKIGGDIQGAEFNSPSSIKYDDEGNLWVLNYLQRVHRLTESLEVDYSVVVYEVPSLTNTGTRNCFDFTLDRLSDGTPIVIMPSWSYHCVRVYNRDTGELLTTIGVPVSAGNLDAGRLQNPFSGLLLPNDNILVSSYNGADAAGNSTLGTISEWNLSGELVETHFVGGVSNVGSSFIDRPASLVYANDEKTHYWAVSYTDAIIAKVNTSTHLIEDIITSPTDADIGQSFGLSVKADGNLIISSRRSDRIYIINVETKALINTINPLEYGAQSPDIRGVLELVDGCIAWADGTSRLIYFSTPSTVAIQYNVPDVPDGWEIFSDAFPDEMNDDFQMVVSPQSIPELIVPVIFPTRKIT